MSVFNRKAVKMSALSSDRIDKFKYHTGEEILPCKQERIIEQLNFFFSIRKKF